MKDRVVFFILGAIMALTACSGKMMEPVMKPFIEPEIPEITFENALDLVPGIYRIKPIVSSQGIDFIRSLYWGNISSGVILNRATLQAPVKISMTLIVNPRIYSRTLQGERMIEYGDEILVEIVSKLKQSEEKVDRREGQFTWTRVIYKCKVLKNLSRPEMVIEIKQ